MERFKKCWKGRKRADTPSHRPKADNWQRPAPILIIRYVLEKIKWYYLMGVIKVMDLYLKFRIIGWIIRLGIMAIAVLAVIAYGIYLVKNRWDNSAGQLNDDLSTVDYLELAEVSFVPALQSNSQVMWLDRSLMRVALLVCAILMSRVIWC